MSPPILGIRLEATDESRELPHQEYVQTENTPRP